MRLRLSGTLLRQIAELAGLVHGDGVLLQQGHRGSGKDHTLQEVAQKTVILVYQDGKWSVKSGVSSDGFVEFKVTCENPADLADTPTKRIVTAPEVILKDDTKLTQGINYVKATEENGELIAYVSDDTANILFEVKISVDGAMAITVEDLAEDAQFAGH